MSKIKLQAISIGIAAVLLSTLLIWFGYKTISRISNVETYWRDYNANETAVAKYLHQFSAEFGVGSFIHDFKVYLLTQDESLIPRIEASIENTYQALDQYLELNVSDEEERVLHDLRHRVDIYVYKYRFSRDLLAKGLSPQEVEYQAQVNDAPVREAVKFLSQVAKMRSKTKQVETHQVLMETVSGISWASALILLIIVVAVVMIRFLRDAWTANQRVIEVSNSIKGIIEAAPDAILSVNSKGQILQANLQTELLFGYSTEELMQMSVEQLMPDSFQNSHEKMRQQYFDKPRLRLMGDGLELFAQHRNGEMFPVEISLNYTVLKQERVAIATIRDIAERRQTEMRMRQAATVFDNTDEAIVFADSDRKIVNVNKAFTKMTGFSLEEACGKDDHFFCNLTDSVRVHNKQISALQKFGIWRGESIVKRKHSGSYPVWHSVSEVKDSDGTVTSYISLFSDISVIKQTEEWLTHLAHHDSLTGLPNRTLFSARLGQAIELSKRRGKKFALLFLDLDRFKIINDTLGHASGDHLLNEVGERLLERVRGDDTVARLGGDEFTVILNNIAHSEDAAMVAEKIIESLSSPIDIEGREVVTSTSVGISVYPDDAEDAESLAKAADAAMYRAKEFGRNNFQFYSAEMTRKAFERLSVEQGLRHSLANKEFVLLYQPQFSLKTGQIVGVEALLRWRHPELGMVSPERFIPVAEETGLIEPIGEWVLKTACEQLREWNAMGLPRVRMAVNVSLRQLADDMSINRLLATLDTLNLLQDNLNLELEITESTLKMAERSVSILKNLKSKGVGLAIDDFGTGYSSLSRLKHLPIDTLKIDRSFVTDIPYDQDDNAIAAAVIAMGHSLNLSIVGEGVETAEQSRFLEEHGCDHVQGYLYSLPVTSEEIIELLRENKNRDVG